VPVGYAHRERGQAEGLALAAAADWLGDALDTAGTLEAWARAVGLVPEDSSTAVSDPDSDSDAAAETATHPRTTRGRGELHVVRAVVVGPDRRERWAVRHYRRGGAVASYLGDRYLAVGATRPEVEIRASVAARARGVRTPAVVAGAWYHAGAFYRADLVTELVPGATTLADALFSAPRPAARERSLAAAGRLVRELGEAGIGHVDLNAGNILEGTDSPAAGPWVIDLDRATVEGRTGIEAARPMLARLERSLRKFGTTSGRPLSGAEWAALRAGFEERV
jgi:tRNA A-37 threonylcarbamoyl transferase component Bud32